MAIEGVDQPAVLQVGDGIRLRKYEGVYDFAFDWYQDEETVYLVDSVRVPYTHEKLKRMYEYLDHHGELYFIEVMEKGVYKPIGDVTFWKDDMPIVIGEKRYRGKGIGRKVIRTLIDRGRKLGYDCLYVSEIYEFNVASTKCFESLGFRVCGQTDKGKRYLLKL